MSLDRPPRNAYRPSRSESSPNETPRSRSASNSSGRRTARVCTSSSRVDGGRDDALVELARGPGLARRGLGELRVLEEAAKDEIVPGEARDRSDERARRLLVDDVGEEHDERAPGAACAEELERGTVVGLGRGHLEAA